jgi:3-oxoacyl-(acyl-carrier-protein) synthase
MPTADRSEQREHRFEGDIRPIPDPTVLTTQQLATAMTSLKELIDVRFNQAHDEAILRNEILETRLKAMDMAIALVQTAADRIPGYVDEKINSLRSVHEERFNSIQVQFKERDVRTEQTSKDSKVAVDAALQAAKEAVTEQNRSAALAISKSEASTIKQIDQMGLQIQTGNKSMDDKFGDIKERLTRIEGKDVGHTATVAQQSTASSFILAIVVGIAGIVIGLGAIAVSVLKR